MQYNRPAADTQYSRPVADTQEQDRQPPEPSEPQRPPEDHRPKILAGAVPVLSNGQGFNMQAQGRRPRPKSLADGIPSDTMNQVFSKFY